ncbi:hypothetical protein L3X38_011463 [Prunus dulcis]|uniref:Basic-leucine zipper transcription factor family protein n=1 Tax=Prunus dulcis TaxID=3755 RepID=A0AAD4WJQ3_PRUDU|nr:hypothetical protein L3X38_011463 [Prunus dulcis]
MSDYRSSDSVPLIVLPPFLGIGLSLYRPWEACLYPFFRCGTAGADREHDTCPRHPGQRSRIRKLQYIAELERTVGVLQTLESELAVKVASLLQQHVALSMENNKLKQQLARLRQGKFIVDSQYQSLKKEIKRLKIGLTNPRNKKVEAYFGSSSTTEAARVEAMQNLDMGKLTLS